MTNRTKILENIILARAPGFNIKFKDESKLMRFIGKVMFFNKRFMYYTTTIGKTVYFPDRKSFEFNPESYFETLSHEYVHVLDDIKHPILFKLKYAFPQFLAFPAFLFIILSPILIPLMVLSIISPLWLLMLASALFLLPIPSPGRTKAEIRGYGMSIKVRVWNNYYSPDYLERLVEHFISPDYYYMCPFKDYVIKELNKFVEGDGCLNDELPCYRDVYNIIKSI